MCVTTVWSIQMKDAAAPLLVYHYQMLCMLQWLSALHRSNQYYNKCQNMPDDTGITIVVSMGQITPILQHHTETSCMSSFRHVCKVFMNSDQKFRYVCLSIHPYGTWHPLYSYYNVSYLGFLLEFVNTFWFLLNLDKNSRPRKGKFWVTIVVGNWI